MCGICGRINAGGQPVAGDQLGRMVATLTHRGPDQEGMHLGEGLGLGFRRLAVIDLVTGDQPMATPDGASVLVFNGEIYNFQTLRAELARAGHSFTTKSDTEVILHAYEAFGLDFVHHLRGMFALALWDERRRRLVLARDRLGKKPLFYWHTPEGLSFASEMKALLSDERLPRTVRPEALDQYLAFQYTPGDRTILDAVRRVPPAHRLVYTPDDGRLRCDRYWTPVPDNGRQTDVPEVDDVLREAVRLRLISDVPLGAFLSGGLDSSLVVALMAAEMDEPVKTFSIGFEEAAFNELPFARLVADRYGTDHHEFVVHPDVEDVLPKLVWYADEPFGDASALPTYYVAQMAREHVTVALSGDGGDEGFGGYRHYKTVLQTLWYAGLPRVVRQSIVEPVLAALPARGTVRRLQQMAADARTPLAAQYARRMRLLPPTAQRALYTEAFAARLTEEPGAFMAGRFPATSASALARMTLADVQDLLPGDFLVKIDRMSMAHGLEVRSPFLDHRVVEAALRLPDAARMRWYGPGKRLLRRHYGPLLPRPILTRKKSGFSVPVNRWFRGPLRALCADVLLSPRALQRGYFEPDALRALIDQHQRGAAEHGHVLWVLIMLELWMQRFLDAP